MTANGRVRLLPNRVVFRHSIDIRGSAGASPSHQLEAKFLSTRQRKHFEHFFID